MKEILEASGTPVKRLAVRSGIAEEELEALIKAGFLHGSPRDGTITARR